MSGVSRDGQFSASAAASGVDHEREAELLNDVRFRFIFLSKRFGGDKNATSVASKIAIFPHICS